jgi:hypothetical protein
VLSGIESAYSCNGFRVPWLTVFESLMRSHRLHFYCLVDLFVFEDIDALTGITNNK